MRRIIMAGTSLLVLAGCGGSQDAAGANSPDSITTTAVGNVVATIPSPTPTPALDVSGILSNTAADSGAMSNDGMATNTM